MKHQVTGEGYVGAIKSLDIAIKNNPKNATAWLWRGITYKDMGYIEKSVADFEQCLEIDAGYLLCSQYLASGLLYSGQIEAAIKQFEKTFENNFHALDDQFVSYYVRTGQRNMAYLIGALGLQDNKYVPVKEWVEAIENPLEDHSAQLARFSQWGTAYNIDVCDMDTVAIALQQDECFSTVENAGLMWHPDAAYYRKKPAFKTYVNTHLRDFWEQNGHPPQCRVLDGGDYECD
jgi:tetratricopeptide (TPR) repeat protein